MLVFSCARYDDFVSQVLAELRELLERILQFWPGGGQGAVLPPISENGALLQFLPENLQRLMSDVSVVGKRGIGHRRFGQERKKMASTSRRRKLEVLLELVEEFDEFGQQSGIFFQFLHPRRFGCRA